ncbi:putative Ecdysteroid kinase-containing protein 7, partial [Homarus americanus]
TDETQLAKNIKPQSLVTEADVKVALKADKGPDAQLSSWTVEDFTKQGDNYACVVSSVRVKFSCQGHNSEVVYVVKLNPCRPMAFWVDVTELFFLKESKFYTTLVPELNSALTTNGQERLRVPRCFHCVMESGREVIYLEDLRPLGFKMFDRRKGLDVPHAVLILQELGRLHASSLVLQAKSPGEDIIQRHNYLLKEWTTLTDSTVHLFEECLRTARDMLLKFKGYERAIIWIESLKPKIIEILKEQLGSSKYNVVCHGDCWNNNVLFRYNEEGVPVEVMLLDLQVVRWASPATDLNYLLYTSLTGEVRKPNLDSFLASYNSSFTKVMEAAHLDMPFTDSQIYHDFRDKNLIGALFAIMIVQFILFEPEDIPDMSGAKNESFEQLMNEFKVKSIELLDTNPLMQPRFLSVFDEMMEVGLIP